MRTLFLGAVLALTVAAPAAAAETTPADAAKAACKAEKPALGTKLFKRGYGVEEHREGDGGVHREDRARRRGRRRERRAGVQGRARRRAGAFAEKYGTNKNKKNAYGKCVSGKARRPSRRRPRSASTPPRRARR